MYKPHLKYLFKMFKLKTGKIARKTESVNLQPSLIK